ncbi:MAG: neutral/alkaline non-lysosomal ceramidase C-terminal domain-containing protein [Planctomycetota bacterium]
MDRGWPRAGGASPRERPGQRLPGPARPDPAPRPAAGGAARTTWDELPAGKTWGEVRADAAPSYARGATASATFCSAHPRNDLRLAVSFLEVQRLERGQWRSVADDDHPDTRFRWSRRQNELRQSTAAIEWDIPRNAAPGTYRLVHHGTARPGRSAPLLPFVGVSRSFLVR